MLDVIRNHEHTGNQALHALWLSNQLSVLRYERLENVKSIMYGKRFPYVSHFQSSKNCYVHASSATVGYKVAFGQKESNLKLASVDVPRLIRHSFHDAKLKRRVIDNKGGSSMSLVRNLIHESEQCRLVPIVPTLGKGAERVADDIDEHGPALVRRFVVDEFFSSKRNETAENGDSGEIFIQQFDRAGGRDTHKFLSLGKSTEEELQTVKQIEDANLSPAGAGCIEIGIQGFLDEVEDDEEETKDGLHAMVCDWTLLRDG